MKNELCKYLMELNTKDGSEQESEDWTALVHPPTPLTESGRETTCV